MGLDHKKKTGEGNVEADLTPVLEPRRKRGGRPLSARGEGLREAKGRGSSRTPRTRRTTTPFRFLIFPPHEKARNIPQQSVVASEFTPRNAV